MSRCTKKERNAFIEMMQVEFPEFIYVSVLCSSIMRQGRTIGRIAEEDCNFPKSMDQQKIDEKTINRCEKLILDMCKEFPTRWCVTRIDENGLNKKILFCDTSPSSPRVHSDALCFKWLLDHVPYSVSHATMHEGYKIEEIGVIPMFDGDPRGNVVKLKVPSGKYDNLGGEGISVPTS